jgi:HEAT repeat protein
MSWAARTFWESQNPASAAARGLRSPNPSDREDAARQLMSMGMREPGAAIPPLIDAIGDPEATVRAAVVESLGAIGADAARTGSDPGAVHAAIAGLIRSLNDAEPAVRFAAIRGLLSVSSVKGVAGSFDLRAVAEALAATLSDRDDRVRLAALEVLAHCGPLVLSDPPPALVAALEDRSAKHRAAAISALTRFRCSLDRWLPFLVQTIQHDQPEVRSACWWAFARIEPPAFSAAAIPALVAALGSHSRIVRSHAARALYPHDRDPRAAVAIPALLTLLREPIDPEVLRPPVSVQSRDWSGWDPSVLAAHLLGSLAPGTRSAGEVIAALSEVVGSAHRSRRPTAARALGEFGPAARSAIPALVRALRDDIATKADDSYLYGPSAAWALGRIAPGTKSAGEALAALIEALDPRSEVRLATRIAAIEALPAFRATDPRIAPLLRAWQKDPDPHLRMAADKAATVLDGGDMQEHGRDRRPEGH